MKSPCRVELVQMTFCQRTAGESRRRQVEDVVTVRVRSTEARLRLGTRRRGWLSGYAGEHRRCGCTEEHWRRSGWLTAARGSRRETVRRRGAVSTGQLRRWRKCGGAGGLGETVTRVDLRRWIEEDDEKKQDLNVRLKKAEIRFSRDDRTRWSNDRT
jgi:hypothetical protein